MENKLNPIHHAQNAPRCGAKTRKGAPCNSPAVKGRKRCRMHGGNSLGAPKGKMHGRYRNGLHTYEMKEERQNFRELLKDIKETLREVSAISYDCQQLRGHL